MTLSGNDLLGALIERGMFQTWLRHRPKGWRLASGLWSPFYVQLRRLPSHPDLLAGIGAGLAAAIAEQAPETTRLIGIAMAGVPIATAVSLASGIPAGFTRKVEGVSSAEELEANLAAYGGHRLVEADLADGDRIVLVDDLLTSYASKGIAVAQIREEARRQGVKPVIEGLAVVLLRGKEGKEKAKAAGLRLHSLLEISPEVVASLTGALSAREAEVIAAYLADPAPFMAPEIRESLRAEAQRE